MRGISNRKEIVDQIPLLTEGKIKTILVKNREGNPIGELSCKRVEYGEIEIGFSQDNISEKYKTMSEWNVVFSLLDRVCYEINKLPKRWYTK